MSDGNASGGREAKLNVHTDDPNSGGTGTSSGAGTGDASGGSVGNESGAQSRRSRPKLIRSSIAQVGDIKMGFYQDERGNVDIGTGRVVEVTRNGVFIGHPVHPSENQQGQNCRDAQGCKDHQTDQNGGNGETGGNGDQGSQKQN
ncbi:hypothetical protein BJX76DRAFT_360115 [Aspergillus varians]